MRRKPVISCPDVVRTAICALAAFAGGCTTQSADGTVRRYSFGFTVVTMPKSAPSRPDFAVREVKTYGVAVGMGGAALGYSHVQAVSLPPEGAMYVQASTPEDFQKVKELIEKYPNKDICVTQASAR